MRLIIIAFIAYCVSAFIFTSSGWFIPGPKTVFHYPLVVAGVAAFLFSLKRDGGGKPVSIPDFKADHTHENVAIDVGRGKIWLRDANGESKVLKKADILRWNTSAVSGSTSLGPYKEKTEIEVHVSDLAKPVWRIKFDAHGTRGIWNLRKNEAEMNEWFSRLTTWMNNS